MPVMTAAAMPVTDEQRRALERLATSTSSPHRQVMQARGLLLACDGVANEEIARMKSPQGWGLLLVRLVTKAPDRAHPPSIRSCMSDQADEYANESRTSHVMAQHAFGNRRRRRRLAGHQGSGAVGGTRRRATQHPADARACGFTGSLDLVVEAAGARPPDALAAALRAPIARRGAQGRRRGFSGWRSRRGPHRNP